VEVVDLRGQAFRRGGHRAWLAMALFSAAVVCSVQCTQISFVLVDTFDDLADTGPGDGACATAAGTCSLRAAIQEANAQIGRQEIRLPQGFYLLSLEGAYEDRAETGDLDVLNDLAIRGLGDAAHTVIDAQALDRVFELHSGAHLLLEGVMVQGGYADSDTVNGAGIQVADGARLNLYRAMVNGNRAVGSGGGIYNLGQTIILRSTISHNRSDEDGGGIYNEGVLALSMSTVSTNDAGGRGGGIGQSDAASTIIANATFNLNIANDGGSLDSQQGSVSMVNTILANSPSGGNCTPGPISSGGHNLSSDASCELEGPDDVTNTDPMLSGLHSVAGKGLPVHVLLEGSPAIGAGDRSVIDASRGDQLDIVRSEIQIGAVGDLGPVLGVIGTLYVPTYATSGPGGAVQIYNTVNHSLIGTMQVPDVRAAEVHPYGNVLYLARGRYQDATVPNELIAYQLPSLNHIWTVPLPGVPNAVAASGSSLQVYVVGANFTSNAGYVTSINTGTAVSSHLTGLDLAPLLIDADLNSTNGSLYITGDASGSSSQEEIRIYSTSTETLVPSAIITSLGPAWSIAPGVSPARMYVNLIDTKVVMFASFFNFTTPLGTLTKTAGSGGDIVVHPDGNRVYVGSGLGVLDVINVSSGNVITTLSAGTSSLAAHPSGWWVYAGESFGSVDVINASSNSVTTTLSLPSSHSVSKMAVGP